VGACLTICLGLKPVHGVPDLQDTDRGVRVMDYLELVLLDKY
jgi:hypothetical protein